jgi:GAF domain-containing protein
MHRAIKPHPHHLRDATRFAAVELGGIRTFVAVPMLKDEKLIGTVILYRQEVRPFTDKQIALVTNFAAQAVIAIENARLLNGLQQSLEQQTATADVLKVVSRSTFVLQAVLDALVESATRLCAARDGIIFLPSGDVYRAAAYYGFTPEYHQFIESNPISIDAGSLVGRAAIEGRVVHVSDVMTDPNYTRYDAAQRIGRYRAALAVPLLREGCVVGVIFLSKAEAQPFPDKQIDLVKTFADQAVIAIENTRLFEAEQQRTRELAESLEQQTATSEVLNVISRSNFELQPVFDAIVQTASRLCDAEFALIFKRLDGKYHLAASNNATAAFVRHAAANPIVPGRGSLVGRTALERDTVHMPDCLVDPEYNYFEYQRSGQYRTMPWSTAVARRNADRRHWPDAGCGQTIH